MCPSRYSASPLAGAARSKRASSTTQSGSCIEDIKRDRINERRVHRVPSLRKATASWWRKRPTSVTTPTVCVEPRSLSLVTTAGLMSTDTTFTHDGTMLPTPMLCSIERSMMTTPTSASASA